MGRVTVPSSFASSHRRAQSLARSVHTCPRTPRRLPPSRQRQARAPGTSGMSGKIVDISYHTTHHCATPATLTHTPQTEFRSITAPQPICCPCRKRWRCKHNSRSVLVATLVVVRQSVLGVCDDSHIYIYEKVPVPIHVKLQKQVRPPCTRPRNRHTDGCSTCCILRTIPVDTCRRDPGTACVRVCRAQRK